MHGACGGALLVYSLPHRELVIGQLDQLIGCGEGGEDREGGGGLAAERAEIERGVIKRGRWLGWDGRGRDPAKCLMRTCQLAQVEARAQPLHLPCPGAPLSSPRRAPSPPLPQQVRTHLPACPG